MACDCQSPFEQRARLFRLTTRETQTGERQDGPAMILVAR